MNDDVRCPICNLNLQVLTEMKREEHCDLCLDTVGYGEPVNQKSGSNVVEKAKAEQTAIKHELTPFSLLDKPVFPSIKSTATSWFFEMGKRKREEDGLNTDSSRTSQKQQALTKSSSISTKRKAQNKKPMPFYKTLIFGTTKIAVDAFNYGAIPEVNAYFLTHFHSDHYGGLSKSWNHGPIYCSPVTARLAILKLKLNQDMVVPLELNKEHDIHGINTILFDANHCPGAVVFLFDKTILHTGDFRATEQLVNEVKLFTSYLDTIYLDTTYLDPARKFPPQDLVVSVCADYCSKLQSTPLPRDFFSIAPRSRRILVMCGTYTIGKERLALAIAQKLNNRIWAQPWKQKILETIDDTLLNAPLSDDGTDAQVHLVSMAELTHAKLEQKWRYLRKHFTDLVAFIPTGWTWTKNETTFDLKSIDNPQFTTVSHGGLIRICRVPYSEHSSFSDLERFCGSVRFKNLIATVHTKRYDILRQWETVSKDHI